MNLDKAREITAGSWLCSARAAAEQLGFAVGRPAVRPAARNGRVVSARGMALSWSAGRRFSNFSPPLSTLDLRRSWSTDFVFANFRCHLGGFLAAGVNCQRAVRLRETVAHPYKRICYGYHKRPTGSRQVFVPAGRLGGSCTAAAT